MISKDEIRKRRDGAISANLGIDPGDKIVEMISRQDGLYIISLEKSIRVNLPDNIDPDMEYPDAPTTQTLVISKGSRNAIVARTILQAKDFSQFLTNEDVRKKVMDIAWEAMQSLLAFSETVEWLRISIHEKKNEIAKDHERYISGTSPPPVPIVDGLETEFRSAVLIANHSLNAISELFPALFNLGGKFRRGRFDLISKWCSEQFGDDDLLSLMLQSDHRWINLWGEVRNAFEHPADDYYVKVNNFRLLPNRQIQLPTWQLKHREFLDVFRPQQLVETLQLHQNNILTLFENLLVALIDKVIKLPAPFAIVDMAESDRDPDCPKRYRIAPAIPAKRHAAT